jgi:uncharacterized membrane protein YvlD (DUF360 family)
MATFGVKMLKLRNFLRLGGLFFEVVNIVIIIIKHYFTYHHRIYFALWYSILLCVTLHLNEDCQC